MRFIKINNHTADYLQEEVLNNLKQLSLDIENCRGQSYDNAANTQVCLGNAMVCRQK